MAVSMTRQVDTITVSSTSHAGNPVPEEPTSLPHLKIMHPATNASSPDSHSSSVSTPGTVEPISGMETPSTPWNEPLPDDLTDGILDLTLSSKSPPSTTKRRRRASTVLISQSSEDVEKILGSGQGGTHVLEKICCGGGCCKLQPLQEPASSSSIHLVIKPKNQAFESLKLHLGQLSHDSVLTNIIPLPEKTVSFSPVPTELADREPGPADHPPQFVQPHPPYEVFRAPLYHARELTKPGAEKRTYHFDIDVTDYPVEGGDVDFVVGGAIGICPQNSDEVVDEVFNLLSIPKMVRDKRVMVNTTTGRWPTVWGDEKPRSLLTTRRELLSWCSDLQSYPPTKQMFRLLAEYATDRDEKKILMFLSSAQGQGAFCDLRTGQHTTVPQVLSAFPSAQPPLDYLLSILNTLMPRFYSLSQDPLVSCTLRDGKCRRLIEIAVTVHESPDWHGGRRTGVGSGFLERKAKQLLRAEELGDDISSLNLHIPMFRGLMANPLAREFVSDGPMLLIGAGVGVAPFRGFVQRRLRSANCANKVWVLQGIRDSLLDELYSGEWGVHEDTVKRVVQSRRGEGKYVQEEVRNQADLVWFVINSLDGRVFVCGSSKGMGEGVEAALVDVAVAKGNLNREEAKLFWQGKKDAGQYIAETW
ncbi:FAD binding domain-containing protein [Histoplasma capsulatum var. duboisii H88]|uniref:FAD binding domain-containing protein n=3 Tax=Ajellomyces capsulatus TaxID=5037 RepID=C0NY29_AJECG|nr:FAD binding domain-containing protein [Histoplasma capsulatum G186AR]EGC48030.1 FAD binding domain-containing protein [Histoplasma capsulatum var. duboisii H88]KAG5293726.1 FAD binding domain-containing protein [Histoplasma capsulatum]EEH03698.1 FAD binding domain-containing protein [Histoplasma capsulatum G186AR]QSS54178.1 FAD binding domain-containing protein [Histoplasma capsulatum var. duboisii H88]QSS75178.1 FAD binding domain-containing protein [Histoplasma capsulatum G186AR]